MNDICESGENWISQVRCLLDAQTGSLDAVTLQRLNRAREAALGAHREPRCWRLPLRAAAASAVVLMLAFALRPTSAPVTSFEPASEVEDTELFVGDDTLDLYQDFEFYAWLGAGGADNG